MRNSHHNNPIRVLAMAASAGAFALAGLAFGAAPVAASTSATQAGAAVTCSRGDATVFGLGPDGKTVSVTTLKTPLIGGPSGPPRLVTKLPFAVHAIAAITASTLFVTDARGTLYEVDLSFGATGAIKTTRQKLATGWTYDLMTYDGEGNLFGLAGDRLERHNLGTAPLNANGTPVVGSGATLAGGFTVGPAQVVGSGYAYTTLSGLGGDWLLASTATGEWDAVEVTGDTAPTATQHILGVAAQTYTNLVATTSGAYYGLGQDGSLTWFVDADPTNGLGSDISGGKTIDASGWSQTRISAVPSTCGSAEVGISLGGPRAIGRTRGSNGFGAGWCTQGAAEMFHQATGMWMDIHGDAWAWADSARRAGWTVVAAPEARSVIVFQPNVQIGRDHAGALGHVAWVDTIQTRSDGIWMFIHEMNAYAGRGGWDTRWIKYNPTISAATQEPANQFILAP